MNSREFLQENGERSYLQFFPIVVKCCLSWPGMHNCACLRRAVFPLIGSDHVIIVSAQGPIPQSKIGTLLPNEGGTVNSG